MKTVDALIKAKSLIARNAGEDYAGGGRTYDAMFRNKDGEAVKKRSEATCFCAIGAVIAAVDLDSESRIRGLLDCNPTTSMRKVAFRAFLYLNAASFVLFGESAMYINDFPAGLGETDEVTHAKVMATYDLAIKNAKHRHIGRGVRRLKSVTK